MKTAICLACTGRSIEHTFSNLKSHLLDDFDQRDIFIYLSKTSYTDSALKYLSELNNCFIHVEEETPIDMSGYNFMPFWPPVEKDLNRDEQSGRQIFLQMIKSRAYINTMLKSSNCKYDRVIFSRMDVIYKEPVKQKIKNLDLSKIWIPNFHNWLDGYNDRFAVSTMENMFDYFSLYNYMEKYKNEGVVIHAEQILRHHLDLLKKDVKFFELYFARIRPNGFLHDDFDIIKQQAVRE